MNSSLAEVDNEDYRQWDDEELTSPQEYYRFKLRDSASWSPDRAYGFHQSTPSKLTQAIDASKELLGLGADWDDAGAEPIDASTWRRATDFLRKTIARATTDDAVVPVPQISPCRDGSIDLFWKTSSFTLLINIKPSESNEADYYGETASRLVMKGTFNEDTHDLGVVLKSLLSN